MNFYKQAADILERLTRHEGSIKSLTLGDEVTDKRKMYALVCETLKYRDALNHILEKADILKLEKKLPKTLAMLLVHDLLFTKRGIQASDGPYKQAVLRHKSRLSSELVKLKIKSGVKNNEELVPKAARDAALIPRYVRVNVLKTTVKKAIAHFVKQGFKLEDPVEDPKDLKPKTVRRDYHLPELLVLPPTTDLHADPMYLSGEIILQDKASCFPAHILNPPPGSFAIDGCAAPGNKTSHMACIMGNNGKIWAIDQDKRRLGTLVKLTGKAGCKIIEACHTSFLDLDPNDEKFSKVEYILLDPSCSGSGIISRLDHLVDSFAPENDNVEESDSIQLERLQSLAEFQVSVMLHAFKFPAVKRVSYSTCSIHQEENEDVVKKLLSSNNEFRLATREEALPTWKRRGIATEDFPPGNLL
ncbi:hypothetical protein K7432_013468 [Basidiobolus ranarum]|uniref:SAM-dependent MTase RsmB/NOP-type domain-containing protein n=2 Tax=Basidiobolus ranarum TaxID=34480 RepID=A0ABR2WJD3_9FUNG